MSNFVRWRVGQGKNELRFKWSRGAALALSKEGLRQPDPEQFEAFLLTFLWACCKNPNKGTPEQFADALPEVDGEDPEIKEVLIKLLAQTPEYEPLAKALENSEEDDEEFPAVIEEVEPGKPASPEASEDSLPSGQDSELPVE